MKTLMILLCALVVAGCSVLPPIGLAYWTKPGATQATFDADSRVCLQQASGNGTRAFNQSTYRACMMLKDYERVRHIRQPADAYRGPG